LGDFYAIEMRNYIDNSVWRLLELDSLLANWDGPTIIGGDFNIVITAKDKNNGLRT
jgi:endonuclease/exonuclease/phosphatase (EEP) superfamily protein YafD